MNIHCHQSGCFSPCCINSTAFNRDTLGLTASTAEYKRDPLCHNAWDLLHSLTLHGIHCIQSGCFGPCSMKKWNPIECRGIYAAWLNAVDILQHGQKHLDLMQWIPCSVIECKKFHSLWQNGSRLCAVESMQRGQMHLDWMQWILCSMAKRIPIECRGFHAAWWNASWLNGVYTMQRV